MKKEYIIPIFVPNLGCPNDCTFCNQKKISGKSTDVTAKDVKKTIEFYLKNFKDDSKYVEVAFFGGSFTGIDINIQNELLEAANEYIKAGKVGSIRISTRPDYITRKILRRLKKYHVKTIELGVQSSNDDVLNASKRNHTFKDVIRASKLIRHRGFKLGHQMMVGMPESTEKYEIQTAKDLIKLKPQMVRIYPVLVIKGTELARMYRKGEYEALTVEQAVDRCKELIYLFRRKNIDVIRIGLQPSDEITDPTKDGSSVLAGPYHPAFRQLVESSIWYDGLSEKIKEANNKVKKIEIVVNPVDSNNVIGNKKENIIKLKENYNVDSIIKSSEDIEPGDFEINQVED
jgi:radical SAM enzyme (TIGR01210 family)